MHHVNVCVCVCVCVCVWRVATTVAVLGNNGKLS